MREVRQCEGAGLADCGLWTGSRMVRRALSLRVSQQTCEASLKGLF